MPGHVGLVRDEDDGDPVPVQLLEHRHDLDAGAGIEVARRLVGQNQDRVIDQRTRDGDPLLLPSGELGGMMVLPVSQPNNFEFLSSLAPASARSGAAVEERELYVLERAGPGQEIEPLEHESDLSIPDACQRIPREMGDVVSVEGVAPGSQRVEAPQEVHEGGLARP